MNNKHIALLLVGLATLGVVQGTITVQKNLGTMQNTEKEARASAKAALL